MFAKLIAGLPALLQKVQGARELPQLKQSLEIFFAAHLKGFSCAAVMQPGAITIFSCGSSQALSATGQTELPANAWRWQTSPGQGLHLVAVLLGENQAPPETACHVLATVLEAVSIKLQGETATGQHYLQKVLETGKTGLWEWDSHTDEVHINNVFTSLLGYQAADLQPFTYQQWLQLLHAGDRERMDRLVKDCLAGKCTEINEEVRYRQQSGSYRWMLMKGGYLSGADSRGGPHRRLTCLHIDFMQQKENEEQLNLFRSVINHTYDAVLITEAEPVDHNQGGPRVVYANPAFSRATGYGPEEIVGKTPRMMQGPKTDPRELDKIRRALEKWEPVEVELVNYKKNGEEFWVNFIISPIADETGWFTHWVSVQRDVTERKLSEAKIKNSEANLRLLIDNAPMGVCMVDSHMEVLKANNRFLQGGFLQEGLYGHAEGVKLTEIIRPQLLEIWSQRYLQALQGESFEAEEAFACCGEEMYFQFSFRPVAVDGAVKGVLIIANDITSIKQREIELQKARQQAEAALKTRSDFLSVMSHEIRTPLNSVIGMAHLLQMSELTREQEEILHNLRFSADNLLHLINDILDFSKMQAGKLETVEDPFDLHELVNNLKFSYRTQARDKGIKFWADIYEYVPRIVAGDEARLNQVLNNLLSNAIKFTKQGSVSLEVHYEVQRNEQHVLLFEVCDTGIGMSEAQQQYIFDPFRQANSKTAREYGGTGLGLAITRNLVELMGGSIHLKSTEGKGSVFGIRLPFTIASQARERQQREKPAEPLGNIRVLYVEDVIPNQLLLKGLARLWQMHLDVASSGLEACEKIKDNYYDLVLMDIQMPGMDGYETTRKIREMPDDYYRNVPVIALTAAFSENTRQKIKEAGINDVVFKPLNPHNLYTKIKAFARTQVTRQNRELPLPDNRQQQQGMQPDIDGLDELFAGQQQDYRQFLELTCQELLSFKQGLQTAIADRDMQRFRDVHHKTAGILSIVVFEHFNTLLKKLQAQVQQQQNWEFAEASSKSLGNCFDTLTKALQKKNSTLPASKAG